MEGYRRHDHRRRRAASGRRSQPRGVFRHVLRRCTCGAGEGREGRSVSRVADFYVRLRLGRAARCPFSLFPRGRRHAGRNHRVSGGHGYRVFFSLGARRDETSDRVSTATSQRMFHWSLGGPRRWDLGPARSTASLFLLFFGVPGVVGAGPVAIATKTAAVQQRLGVSKLGPIKSYRPPPLVGVGPVTVATATATVGVGFSFPGTGSLLTVRLCVV